MMPNNHSLESKHFTLEPLADGIYACIHKPGGAAYSNAGIINLGERTLVVDALNTLAAGRDLRQIAEALFERPVDTIILTHPHSDHWIGASAFGASTTLLTSPTIRQVCLEWGEAMVEEYLHPDRWEKHLKGMEKKLRTERDERLRAGLEKSILSTRYTLAEMAEYQPRYADQTFDESLIFQGSKRNAELRSFGRGHSEEDIALLLPQDNIAFIGDIGFFDTQPFMGYCDIECYRQQLQYFQEASFQVLVPGHGPMGGKENITLQLEYFDVLEHLVGEVSRRRGSLKEALQITLPEPFDQWLVGGMERFEVNVRYVYKRFNPKRQK